MNGLECDIRMTLEQKVDNLSDKSSFVYKGTYMDRVEKRFITYRETTEEGQSDVLLKFDAKSMSMTKSGTTNYKMEFSLDGPTDCTISTPAGKLPMKVTTKRMVIKQYDDVIELEADYDLHQAKMLLSSNHLKIDIKIK